MRVRFTIPAYRDRYGADHVKGDVWEYPQHLAVKLIRLRIAEPAPAPEPKTAERKVRTQNTAKRVGKVKGGDE